MNTVTILPTLRTSCFTLLQVYFETSKQPSDQAHENDLRTWTAACSFFWFTYLHHDALL